MQVIFSQVHLCWIATFLLLAGCGGGSDYPDTADVRGKVTMNGAPVAGATVSFSPQGKGNAAAGITDANGEFSLTTFESGDGAVPGTYKVAVSKLEQKALDIPATTGEDPSAAYLAAEAAGQDVMSTGEGPAGQAGQDRDQGPKDLLPAKYKSPETSDLTAEVKKGEDNYFPFDLKQ